MDELSYKVRIAALWLLAIVAFFGYRTLAVGEQAREVSLLGDQDFATYLLVLMAFAFLSLIVPSRLNRLMNMIAGGIFVVLQSIMLADGAFGYPSGIFNVMTGVTVVATASIVWLAFRWPGREHGLRRAGSEVGIEEPASTPRAA
jgi:hypothetical protein